MSNHTNIVRIRVVNQALRELGDQVVFVGGYMPTGRFLKSDRLTILMLLSRSLIINNVSNWKSD